MAARGGGRERAAGGRCHCSGGLQWQEGAGGPSNANAWTQLELVRAGATLVAGEDPVLIPKACKNPVELAGTRSAHQRDAVAEIRFLAWLDGEVAAGQAA